MKNYRISSNSALVRKIRFNNLFNMRIRLEQCLDVLRTTSTSDTQKSSNTYTHTKRSTVMFALCILFFGGSPTPSMMVSLMTSVGTTHSCPPALLSGTRLQIRPEFSSSGEMEYYWKRNWEYRYLWRNDQDSVTSSSYGRTWTDKTGDGSSYASDDVQYLTWWDMCMREDKISGRHGRRESGREDEDSLVVIWSFLKR